MKYSWSFHFPSILPQYLYEKNKVKVYLKSLSEKICGSILKKKSIIIAPYEESIGKQTFLNYSTFSSTILFLPEERALHFNCATQLVLVCKIRVAGFRVPSMLNITKCLLTFCHDSRVAFCNFDTVSLKCYNVSIIHVQFQLLLFCYIWLK